MSFPVPVSAVLVVDRTGTFRLWAQSASEAEGLVESFGPAQWEIFPDDVEGQEQLLRALQAVAAYRATHRVRFQGST